MVELGSRSDKQASIETCPLVGSDCGAGNGNPLQYSCLGNPIIRGAWQATIHRVAKSRHN